MKYLVDILDMKKELTRMRKARKDYFLELSFSSDAKMILHDPEVGGELITFRIMALNKNFLRSCVGGNWRIFHDNSYLVDTHYILINDNNDNCVDCSLETARRLEIKEARYLSNKYNLEAKLIKLYQQKRW